MGSTTLVPVREYLNTSFPDGDRDYVDGRIVERHVGQVEHADVQGRIYRYLCDHYLAFWSGIEVRVQVRPTRFRVPDVILSTGGKPTESIVRFPPHVAVEVLSKDDRAEEMQERIDDYLEFGVKAVWVVNPRTHRGYIHTTEGTHEAKDGLLSAADPAVAIPLKSLFER
jgi:Uma2 family endonuclease